MDLVQGYICSFECQKWLIMTSARHIKFVVLATTLTKKKLVLNMNELEMSSQFVGLALHTNRPRSH